jgi:hypothetical protein
VIGEPLPTGSIAPELAGIDPRSGEKVSSRSMERGGVLLFLSPGCSQCNALVDSFEHAVAIELPPIICVCRGEQHTCQEFLAQVGSEAHLLIDALGEMAALYRVSAFPTAE